MNEVLFIASGGHRPVGREIHQNSYWCVCQCFLHFLCCVCFLCCVFSVCFCVVFSVFSCILRVFFVLPRFSLFSYLVGSIVFYSTFRGSSSSSPLSVCFVVLAWWRGYSFYALLSAKGGPLWYYSNNSFSSYFLELPRTHVLVWHIYSAFWYRFLLSGFLLLHSTFHLYPRCRCCSCPWIRKKTKSQILNSFFRFIHVSQRRQTISMEQRNANNMHQM